MPYSGAGVFSVYTPGTPYVTGTVISSSVANLVNSDFATGLSTAICKDGQTTITANIPMSGFKLTGIGAATGNGQAIRYEQVGTLVAGSGANSDITSLSSLASINGGPIAGFRNRIINGDMRIDQRNAGAAQTFTAAAAVAYCVDRFYGSCTGANVTGQRVAGSGADQYVYQFTGGASVTGITFGQRIEATNIYDLTSQTATFSVELANSLLTSVTWTAYYANSADNFSAKTQIATGTFTVNSSMATYSAQIALGANAGNGVAIELSVGAQTSGTWKIGRVQLEQGSAATVFERRFVGTELALCQRYLPAFAYTTPVEIISSAYGSATNSVVGVLPFKVRARIAPTGVTISAASHISYSAASGTAAASVATFNSSGVDCGTLNITVTATAGQGGLIFFNNASGQILFTGAEL